MRHVLLLTNMDIDIDMYSTTKQYGNNGPTFIFANGL
jgi:hypothetical protein